MPPISWMSKWRILARASRPPSRPRTPRAAARRAIRLARAALEHRESWSASSASDRGGDARFQGVDLPDHGAVLLEQPLVAAAENAGEDVDHEVFRCRRRRKKQGVRTASPLLTSALPVRSAPESTRGVQKPRGILRRAIEPDLEMQVEEDRSTGPSTLRRHPLPAHYEVAFVHVHLGRVGITGIQSVAVVDHDDLPYWGWYPDSTTLPLAAATTGVPLSAGKSMPSWNDCIPVNGSIR